MLSIIVPTMWKFPPFVQFVRDLSKVDIVEEIIIINNDVLHTPVEFNEYNPKIRMGMTDQNIGVNPAWNMGVDLAKSDKIVIINDDIIFDFKILYKLDEFLSESVGVVGLHPGDEALNQENKFVDGSVNIVPWKTVAPDEVHKQRFGFGSLFGIHRSNWVRIPNEMKVYFGDDWVFETQTVINGKVNYLIANSLFHSPWAQTTKDIVDQSTIYNNDMAVFNTKLSSLIRSNVEYHKASQHPSDINEHLVTLKNLARRCNTVTEMGVRDGQSTRAFMSEICKLTSYDLFLDNDVIALFQEANAAGRDVRYLRADTLNLQIEYTDLLFIDTEHTYNQLSQELELHGNKALKYLVFHDTEEPFGQELLPAIFQFMSRNPHWRVHSHHRNNHGLTVLERDYQLNFPTS